MQRTRPVSLNILSYNAVVKILQTIRDIPGYLQEGNEIYIDTVGPCASYLQCSLINNSARGPRVLQIFSSARSWRTIWNLHRWKKSWCEVQSSFRSFNYCQGNMSSKGDARHSLLTNCCQVFRDKSLLTSDSGSNGNHDLDKNFGSGYPSDPTCVHW